MTRKNIPTLDEFWRALAPRLPVLSPRERRAAIVLLRELAKGESVTPAQLARAIGASTAEADALLQHSALKGFVYPDPQGRVAGFFGLATKPTHHRFTLEGRTLWTWCAGDSLFLPELLGETAEVESRDPEGGELVRLRISPARSRPWSPRVSWCPWCGRTRPTSRPPPGSWPRRATSSSSSPPERRGSDGWGSIPKRGCSRWTRGSPLRSGGTRACSDRSWRGEQARRNTSLPDEADVAQALPGDAGYGTPTELLTVERAVPRPVEPLA